jgi:hypothetical protein
MISVAGHRQGRSSRRRQRAGSRNGPFEPGFVVGDPMRQQSSTVGVDDHEAMMVLVRVDPSPRSLGMLPPVLSPGSVDMVAIDVLAVHSTQRSDRRFHTAVETPRGHHAANQAKPPRAKI